MIPDAVKSQDISYTLELDKDDIVIGGEWTSEVFPDFIWTTDSDPDEHESEHDEFEKEKLEELIRLSLEQ